jgi:uncharacterized protein
MRRIITPLTGLLLFCTTYSYAGDTIAKQTWVGKLSFSGMELTLVLNVFRLSPDTLTATLDSPDQGAKGIPVSRILVAPDSLKFKVNRLMASYAGRFNVGNDTLTGMFLQGGYKIPLTLAAQDHEYRLNRPQEPRPPFPYQSEEVTIKNAEAGVELAGTLTYPEGPGPFPAVVLVTGSGPENRDEEIFGHRPFLVIADRLTREGFAVLRYDDRGYGKSTGTFGTATTFDFAGDADAAVDFLKKRPGIDSSRVGILGHSEGGLVAEVVAADRNDIGFIVLLAGTAITGEQILMLQSRLIAQAAGIPEKEIVENEKLNSQIYAILKKTADNDKAGAKIRKVLENYAKKNAKEGAESIPESQIDAQIKTVTSSWFRTFLTLDPITYTGKIKCPVLGLFGEMDLQVPPAENMKALETGLLFSGNEKYTIDYVPGVNHMFQTATTGAPSEYGRIEETISPVVLDMITDWLKRNVK